MKICTFAGHSKCGSLITAEKTLNALRNIIEENNDITFYSGGMGDFDMLCEACVRDLRCIFSEKNILLYLIAPFYSQDMRYNPQHYSTAYDKIIVPDCMENTDTKAKIPVRNNWMVDNADYVLVNIEHNYGGAWHTFSYAQRLHKYIINVHDIKYSPAYSFEEAYGKIIRFNRMRKGISLETFARMAHINKDYLKNIENNEKNPTLDAMCKIAKAFSVEPHTILLETENYIKNQ